MKNPLQLETDPADNRPAKVSLRRILHRLYSTAAMRLRSNRDLHRMLFGYRPENRFSGGSWDWTTLLLRDVMKKRLRPEMSFLDMGTGPCGALALFAALNLGCRNVRAVDHLPELVDSARRCAEICGADVRFGVGDLFEGMDERFDMIVFNAPYMNPAYGRSVGLIRDNLDERRWSGGPDGCRTIVRCLGQCPGHLAPGGLALLGANAFHLPLARLEGMVDRSGLRPVGKIRHPLTLSYVFMLESKQ